MSYTVPPPIDFAFPFKVFVLMLTIVAIAATIHGGRYWQCSELAKSTGLRTGYTFANGCMVEVKPGRWSPEERWREVP